MTLTEYMYSVVCDASVMRSELLPCYRRPAIKAKYLLFNITIRLRLFG